MDEKYFRPSEVQTLLGDSSKARKKLAWEPKYSLEELVKEMIAHDVSSIKDCKKYSHKAKTINLKIFINNLLNN